MNSRSDRNLTVVEDRAATLAWLERAAIELSGAGTVYRSCADAARHYRALATRLTPAPTIAIVGESNTGKSTLANMLAQNELLPTSVFQSTRVPKLLTHDVQVRVTAHTRDGKEEQLPFDGTLSDKFALSHVEVGLPLERLRLFRVLDLPGVDVVPFDQTLATLAALKPDLTLYCTVATQAWKESERAAWQDLAKHKRNRGFLVVTHADLVTGEEREAIAARLRSATSDLFEGITFVIDRSEPRTTDPMHVRTDAGSALDGTGAILRQVETIDRQRARRVRDIARWIASRSRKSLERELATSDALIDRLSQI